MSVELKLAEAPEVTTAVPAAPVADGKVGAETAAAPTDARLAEEWTHEGTPAARRFLTGAGNVVGGAAAVGIGALVANQVALRAGIRLQPRPMPHQMHAWLEHPLRLRYRNPTELLTVMGLFNGMVVADLGCGTGLFTVELARRVGPTGRVHAVDLQAAMVAHTTARVAAEGFADRVSLHRAGLHTLPLRDQSVEVALMVATLGEVPAPVLALDEIRRVLKPGGRLVVSEELPDPAYLPSPLVRRWASDAGLRFGGVTGSPFCYHALFFADA
jgi:SAM-dependent methyltransferase